MRITLNGRPEDVEEGMRLLDLVSAKGLAREAVLVEYNRSALRQRDLDGIVLREGDEIELLRISAGG